MIMDEQDYVTALYRTVLNREPDPDGLRDWTALLRKGGDPTAVLAGLLDSAECRAKADGTNVEDSNVLVSAVAAELAGRSLTVVDVGAQNLSYEGHIYQPLCTPGIAHRVIGFEPLLDRVCERETSERGSNVELLPYAVGDGNRQVLYINNEDATSSLFPLNVDFNAQFEHLFGLRTLKQVPIETKRLDDVLPPGPVDFLKLDVQGAELMVLQGAEQTLRRTAVIHCEVEFAPIYTGQPLYCEIQSFLASHGFCLIDILISHRYSYVVPSGRSAGDRLLWGDAVFFREEADAAMLLAQALAGLLVYNKPTLSEHLLARRDAMTGETLAGLFHEASPKI